MQYHTQIGPALVTLAAITLFHANGVIDGCPGSSHRANLSCRKMTGAYETFVGSLPFMTLLQILSCEVSNYTCCHQLSTSVYPPLRIPTPFFSAEDIMNIPIDSVWAVISVIV